MDTIIELLDRLAEFQAQADSLDNERRKLIDDVQIPAEVQAIHDEGQMRKRIIDADLRQKSTLLAEELRSALSIVVIPPEIQAAYEAIARQKAEITAYFDQKARSDQQEADQRKAAVDTEFSKSVEDVYRQVEERKQEISAEFTGKSVAVANNIADLTTRIKDEVKAAGASIKGKAYHAIYVKGRVTWITDMLDGMIVAFPELAKARKEGEPSVTIRKI